MIGRVALRVVACGAVAGLCTSALACRDPGRDAAHDLDASLPAASRAVADAAVDAGAPAPRRLVPGAWLVDRLTGTDSHAFLLDLAAGEAAAVTVEGREVNTRLVVDGPGDQNRYLVEDLARAVGVVEAYVIVARESGTFRLTLQSMMARGRGGEYAVRAEVRAATERDRLAAELQERRYHLWRASEGHRRQVVLPGDPPRDDLLKPPTALFDAAKPALALARQLGDRVREARLLGFQGDQRRWDDRLDDATRLWRASLRIARDIGDRAGEGTALGQLGLLALFAADIAAALPLLRQGVELCRAIQNHYCVAYTLNDLGTIDLRVAEPERALADFRESGELWAALGNAYDHSMAVLNMSVAYDVAGDAPRALASLDEAEALWQPGPGAYTAELGYRPLTRGQIHLGLERDPARALAAFESALAMARDGRHSQLIVASLSSMSQAHLELGAPARAVALASEALETARQSGIAMDLGKVRATVGDAQYALGDLPAAHAAFTYAAAEARRQNGDILEATALTGLARTQRAQGNRRGALASIRAAVDRVESARARVHLDHLRATYLSRTRDSYDLYVELLLDGGRSADVERALAVAEQARARTLRETLAAGRVRSPSLAEPALARALETAREDVRVQEMSHELLLQRDPTPAQLATSKRELARRVQAYAEIDARIRARDPAFAALLAPPTLDVAALRNSLAPDETLLAYSLGAGASALWVVSRAGIEVVRLPGRAMIEEQIRQAQVLLTARATTVTGATGERETAEARQARIARADVALPGALVALGHLLFGPARARLNGARLLIVPDGGVAYVPFAALPGADGRPLLESHEILYVPAASLLVAPSGAPRPPARAAASPRVAIVADPVFSKDDLRLAALAVAPSPPSPRPDPLALRGGAFARLVWSGAEADAIAALAPGTTSVAAGFAASEGRVRSEAFARADVVHFATHSMLDVDAPELSAIVLSLVDEQGRAQDGFLRLHEIVELHLDASLVVLSACETALGRRLPGEGLIGLVRGFLHAGADQVMASLWRVHDQGTAELMKRFYAGLLGGGLGAGAALRAAQLAMRAEPRWSSPYYWASFGLQGVPPRSR